MPSTTIRALSILSLSVAALAGGCNNEGLAPRGEGYLASDRCSRNTTAESCGAVASDCSWVATPVAKCADGAKCSPPSPGTATSGACVAQDPCLSLGETACRADGRCAWSGIASLCPVGAVCADNGFCHRIDDSGTDCACVSPIACPAGTDCPPVVCDCSGGGSGGSGGACSCACPPCAPGEACAPCTCDCGDGGSACTQPGTCVTSCPNCTGGADCACTTVCSGGAATVDPAPPKDGGTSPAPEPPCACDCAPCAPGAACPPCVCNCPNMGSGGTGSGGTGTGNSNSGCIPPPVPSPVDPSTKPTPCPAIACAQDCANGFVVDANGCTTCTCR